LEQGRFRVLDPGGRDIRIQIFFRFVMWPDQLFFIPFFKEAEPGALALQLQNCEAAWI
jgi:hypothetical protein